MEQLNEEEQKYLLNLARRSIEYFSKYKDTMVIEPAEVPSKKLVEKRSCFVTLYIKDKIVRGCIGRLEATRALVFDVIENAAQAAFGDPRFIPLKPHEIPQVKITISVLTTPEKVEIDKPEEILDKLIPGKHGLVVRKEWKRATYLPGVWKEIPDKEQFLSELCEKAGMEKDEWKEPGIEYETYEVQEFSE